MGRHRSPTDYYGPGHNHGDSGAGSIPFQSGRGVSRDHMIPPTDSAALYLSADPDYSAPKDSEDKSASTPPYGPIASIHRDQPMYDVMALQPGLSQAGEGARRVGPVLPIPAVGVDSSFTFEAGFVPDAWRVYFTSATTLQRLYVSPDETEATPAEWIQNAGAGVQSSILKLPGRSRFLTVRAWASNTATCEVTVVALANVGDGLI